MIFLYNQLLFSYINEILIFAITWITLEKNGLNGRNHTYKTIVYESIFSAMCKAGKSTEIK